MGLKTFWCGLLGIFILFSVTAEAVSAAKKKLYGETQYEACLLASDAQYSSLSNGDTYCCSKSRGQCVRCPQDGNLPCSTFPYSKHPKLPPKPKSLQDQSGAPKAKPADPTPSPKRPVLKTNPETKS